MMKIIKKISVLLLTLCLVAPCFSMVVSAADGKISFSDPDTKVGDMVEVKCAVRSTGSALGEMKIKISYDSEDLSFQSGDGVKMDEAGSLTCTASGGSTEQIFLIEFQALTEGSTQITISDSTVASDSGATLSFDHGTSTVTIAEGDPSKIKEESEGTTAGSAEDMEVEVDGVAYTLSDKFSDGDIPSGYERTEVELEGQKRQMVMNETSQITLAYLIGTDSSDFFIYHTEDATFSQYEELSISDTTSIVLLSDTSAVSLPENYQQAEYTIHEKTFPVWNDSSEPDHYILYAVSSNTGETGYYKYDTVENTYQRFTPDVEEDDDEAGGLLGRVQKFISDNIQKIVLFGGLGLILIVLIILILAVKLHNRNVELDDLYDEYGIDEEEEEKPKDKKKEKKGKLPFAKKRDEDDLEVEDDEFDDDFEDDFATENMGFTEDMGLTEDMGFVEDDFDDDFATEDMGLTEDMGFADEDDFATENINLKEEDFETEEIGLAEEDAFATAHLDYEEGDLLDDVDTDEFVVYGGESRTEELTIDDLDELLGDKSKKKAELDETGTFKMDFVDLD